MCAYYVASDVGGTFTDTVVIDDVGRVGRYKASTVPDNPAEGVLNTLVDAAADRDVDLAELLAGVEVFSHGTTIATNAMLEGRHKKVGLIQTRGFGDTLTISRGFKGIGLTEEETKRFRTLVKQSPAVPPSLTAEITERVDYAGRVVCPLDEDDVRRAVADLRAAGAEVFAVSLLWSFANDVHERRVAEIVAEEVPGASITLSSEFLPRIGEYERTLTTAVNASLRPLLKTSLDSFESTLSEAGLRSGPLLMQSNGGLATFAEVEKRAAATVMSGPVGGVVASQFLGSRKGHRNIVTTDMGGTSFDVGLVLDERPVMSNTTLIGRDQLALPSVAVRAIGAGAGSIASARNGVLRVGPESAGARPGPACYGAGGERPTVADADLVLGYLNPDNFLGGRLALDVDRARRAIDEHVARPAGLSVEQAAEGIKTIVDARMADLVRQVTVEQGYDPTDFAVFAYGGAGPLHAFSYGAELGCPQIVVPITASVHSAFGIGCSDLTMVEELSKPMQTPPGTADYSTALVPEELNATFGELQDRARADLVAAGADDASIRFAKSVEIRFRAQIHVLTVGFDSETITAEDVNTMVDRFVEQYEGRFGKGSAFPGGGVEITTFRVVATSPVPRAEFETGRPADATTAGEPGTRQVFSGGQWVDAAVYRADQLHEGLTIDGLAIVELPDTTVVVGPGQHAAVDGFGDIVIQNHR
ncbi:hydantoinase/oxoprolinase family protein [Saccharopolyspora erythraea]|uniref:hydantoinase/oxoprolinase family protein n=1 Tax=Saccharopolyspora erythraea TaxID=1836 RepID=UPI001BAAAEB5|nr:hydantoinase/oxoprolinase family protein [Saccharopolyspora erythraea]QUH03783.1 hydantoinase/oxoprolinase family protein [Saccharopolyspora erythraea]